MRGNPFFTQLRPGKINKKTGKEKIFKLIKFRTMSNAKDKEGNLLPDDKRLNKYGRFLRSTSLDELPELVAFADKLEAACIETLNQGIMTKDLVGLVVEGTKTQAVNSIDFIKAIRKNLEVTL